MHGSVEKRTLRFGGSNLGGNAFQTNMPGPAALGQLAFGSADAATFAGLVVPLEQCSQKLAIANRGSDVNCIAIAPDSAIHTCDLWIGGKDGEQSHYRVSPGNPFVGCLTESDYVVVTVPVSLPVLSIDLNVSVRTTWDAPPDPSGAVAGWPLVLELWRGAVTPIRGPYRAPYHACFGGTFADGSTTREFYVCLDGRRRVMCELLANPVAAAGAAVTANAIFGSRVAGRVDGGAAIPLAVTAAGGASITVISGANSIFFLPQDPTTPGGTIAPLGIVAIRIAQVTPTQVSTYQLHVHAWDGS